MFLIYGKRTARIKKYSGDHENCRNCKSFDLDIRVYKDYFHIFFLPIFAFGSKTVKIRCNNCGERLWVNEIQKHYEDITKTPFYLYAGIILFSGLILLFVNVNLNTQKEKAKFVGNPKVGDVYTIRKETNNTSTYYFLRLSKISGDTVFAFHNNLEYNGFISKLNDDDFFVKDDELFFLKKELKQMLDKNEINSVEREYGDYEGFNRTR